MKTIEPKQKPIKFNKIKTNKVSVEESRSKTSRDETILKDYETTNITEKHSSEKKILKEMLIVEGN